MKNRGTYHVINDHIQHEEHSSVVHSLDQRMQIFQRAKLRI